MTSINELIKNFEDGIPKALKQTLRPRLKQAASPIVADAKARAFWSTRIPGAIRVSTALSNPKRSGVSIVVNRRQAPHARPYENLGQYGIFRHPVFGNYENWVPEASRPFLFPAVFAHASEVVDAIDRAVADAAEEHGFH